MSLSPTEKSLCNKLVSDYDSLVAPVKSAKSSIKKTMSDLDTYVRGMTFSNPVDLEGAIDDFIDNVESRLPGDDISAMDQLSNFMNNCTYLKDFAPSSSVSGTLGGIFDSIADTLTELVPNFPEFGASSLANAINDLLSGASIPGGDTLAALLAKADDLLNCLSALCATVDPSYIGDLDDISDDLQGLYDDLNLIDTGPNKGKFDYTTFFSTAGLTAAQENAITTVTSSIDSQKAGAVDAVQSSIDKVKELTKLGGFF